MRIKIRHDRAAARDQGTAEAESHARHTYHEFLVGLHLKRIGLSTEYNKRLGSLTPDWSCTNVIVEVFTCERGTTDAGARFASRVAEKSQKYGPAACADRLSFVIAVYIDSDAGLDVARCDSILHASLFAAYPDLSGVLIFTATHGPAYLSNPAAVRAIDLR